jgi:signal transduction histidine kinase
MIYRFLEAFYRHWQLRSLNAKLLLPMVGLMVVSLICSTLAFVGGTALTQDQILRQQIATETRRVTEALNERADTVATAANLLANDPAVVSAIPVDDDDALSTLNGRAVVVRDRFHLDLIQIYDHDGTARTNLVLSSLYRESSLLDEVQEGAPEVRVVEDHVLLLSRESMAEGAGTVIAGVDLESELNRILSEYRLPSDLGLVVSGTHIGTHDELHFDASNGWHGGRYYRHVPLSLGITTADLLLVRPAMDVLQVATTGLLVMIGSMLVTTLFLIALSVIVMRSITRPIQQLANAAESVAAGDLDQQLDVTRLAPPFGIGNEDEIGLLAQTFNDMVADLRSLYSNLEGRVEARTHELATAGEIARAISSSLDLDVVLQRSVDLIRTQLGFYQVGIFLIEPESNVAVLREMTGEIGEALKAQEFHLAVGTKSLVGLAAATHCPRFAQDVHSEPVYLHNPLLPVTRSEATLPLLIGQTVIGVLDVQSDRRDAFPRDMQQLLMALADQIATGVHNARLYAQQREAAEHLAEVDRLKSQFLASMSHELRTPLNSIIGFSKLLLKGMDGPVSETQAQDLRIIHESGQHLLALINDILDISKINAGKIDLTFHAVEIEEVMHNIFDIASVLVQDKPLRLRIDVEPGLPTLYADERRVRQMLLNLISNAIKFTEEGEIIARARLVEGLNTHTKRIEPCVEISIQDTGPGIPEEKRVDIFKEFTQVDNSESRRFGGAGLGLPITKKLVEYHGGRIWVESKLDQGSTFTFILPLNGPERIPVLEGESQVYADTAEYN